MIDRTAIVGLVFLVAGLAGRATGMEFMQHPNASSMPAVTAILATGEIEEGDVERLFEFLSQAEIRSNIAIYLASPGGSLYEGMRLGTVFKERRIKTVVEGDQVCASACALAFLGGRDKEGRPWRSSSSNSLLGFHAFSWAGTTPADADTTQMVVSDVLAYGQLVDAPLELLILNFSTPSHTMYWLNQDEICSLGIKLWDVLGDRFIC
ncbi:MAG: hypothetical protein KIT02_13895 [Devosia sp.]|uniref:COG3904 family protein n=1 Tax=Devosia sp. TaxID=1871048 RepID=UPI0024CA6E3F|nr:hypothetical protein [Devosia sp.]UYN99009.1 MAG: hypothetical protein KIT02_13895 [Devosia sp.]